MPQTSAPLSPRAGSRIRPRLIRYAVAAAAAAAGTLLAVGQPVGAVGLPRPGVAGLGNQLTVTYDDGAGRVVTRTLTCGDAATPDGRDACLRLDELGGPLAPVPAGQMCSMIYGGPQTARVTGVWGGLPVDETYRRTDGCEVSRWARMVPVLPSPADGMDGGRRMLPA
ncbi:SSI family serine proteinase inhibitor [Actinacidiphila paucisporea]|uniref:Subtilisin inhibitor-like n=1 Tax=Actinacidiphila paucisporea TaxID=310782 RepID=A0A1M7CNY8_9ACTN|nr:SSI family serine proteinase inhibitor [Actinacidiphila paucisporea]SHL69018.1 Subtilisin inhibitor-like [Actinacidiphila paucisporea]